MSDTDPRKHDEPPHEKPRRGEHNELGYRNVDEEVEHDEAGSQGPQPGEAQREQ